jgi:hypothetical protein
MASVPEAKDDSVESSRRRKATGGTRRLGPGGSGGAAAGATAPMTAGLLVLTGLAVGVLATLVVQSSRRPPADVGVTTTTIQAPGPDATERDPDAEAPLDAGKAGERTPEQWLAWAHGEVAKAWRIAARSGMARGRTRLLALAREVEDAPGAEGALDVVAVAREQMAFMAGEGPPPRRREVRPPRATEARPPRATEATPPPRATEEPATEEPEPSTEPPAWMPRGLPSEPAPGQPDEPAPVAGPAPTPGQPGVAVLPAGAARAVLYKLYDLVEEEKDEAGGRKLLAELEKAGDLPETFAARGFFLFREGHYASAFEALTRAGDVSKHALRDRAFAALYLGRLDVVRELLAAGTVEDACLKLIVDGPFKSRYPNAADALEARTDDGHYRVVTDIGLTRADLTGLEEKLAGEQDADQRTKLLEKARRQHRGLHELCEIMQKAYKAYDKVFGPDRPGEVVPTVIVFSDRVQFDALSSRLGVGSTENTLGYYWPPYRVLVFYDQDEGQRRGGGAVSKSTLEVLLHETFHQWLDLYVDDAPRWFDEGMAEYFGISELTRTELRYGVVPTTHPSRLDNIRGAFVGDYPPPLPLPQLITADYRTFMRPSQAAINYAQAWSFVHYLGSSPGGQRVLREYFQALRDGLELHDAYERVFGPLDMAAMEKEWRAYVGRLR